MIISAPKLDESIYIYSKYKMYIKDWMKQNKISFRQLGRMLNISSVSYIHALTNGTIRGSVSGLTVDNLCKIMKLDREESTFFRLLILLQQSRVTNSDQNMVIVNAVGIYLKCDRIKLMRMGIAGELGERSDEKITYKKLKDSSVLKKLQRSGGIIQ